MSDAVFFHRFIDEMNSLLRENNESDGRGQAKLLNDLFALEKQFKDCLLETKQGKDMYEQFMRFIMDDKGNMLSVRVYFRERQDTFSNKIAVAFHKNDPEKLHKFKINYLFTQWVLKNWKTDGKKNSQKQKDKLEKITNEIANLRKILCENNLPLAINRAKIFWSKVPENHIEYMDLIQTSSEGLITAIDKFVPPYKTVFRSTAIGRMTLNMLTDYNATMVKLPPKEKRILYRANMAKNKEKIVDEQKVTDFVNQSFEGVTSQDIQEIASAAASAVPIDEKPEGGFSLSETLTDFSDPEKASVGADFYGKLGDQIKKLLPIERKVIILKTGI